MQWAKDAENDWPRPFASAWRPERLTVAERVARGKAAHAIAISSYVGNGDAFDRAIAYFSAGHADQNERDYDAFPAAVASGQLAVPGTGRATGPRP